MKQVLLWLVWCAILYDLSIHLLYLFGKEKTILAQKRHWWPEWSGKRYQLFWSVFWGMALVLLTTALFLAD